MDLKIQEVAEHSIVITKDEADILCRLLTRWVDWGAIDYYGGFSTRSPLDELLSNLDFIRRTDED